MKRVYFFLLCLIMGIGVMNAQEAKHIAGLVTDESGQGLPGATVVAKGTSQGTVTNVQGQFTLTTSSNTKQLVVSYLGMVTQEVAVSDQMKIVLKPAASSLSEVVVVGFGVQKKENLTGAVSMAEMEKVLGDRPVTTISSALQGAIPGLQITGGAVPGSGKTFRIRGQGSITGGDPLILLDNVECQIDLINPEDIETVTVLKDAASTAIYGARAAFGVILINSKKAKKNAKMSINYSNNFAFEQSINRLEQVEPLDFLKAYKELGYSNWYSNAQDIDKWMGYINDYNSNPKQFEEDAIANGDFFNPVWGNYIPRGTTSYYYVKKNDAQNEIFDKYGFQQTHNISASGGSDKITFRIGMGYTDQDGPLKTNKDSHRRINISSYVSAQVTNWLNTSVDIRYATSKHSNVDQEYLGQIYSTEYQSFLPKYGNWGSSTDPKGAMYPSSAPLSFIMLAYPNAYRSENPRISTRALITPFKNFEGVVEYTFDGNHYDFKRYNKSFSVRGDQNLTPYNATPTYSNEKSTMRYNSFNAYGTYNYSISEAHNFKLMGGFSQEYEYYERMTGSNNSLINPEMPSFTSSSDPSKKIDDQYLLYSIRSGFFRFNYNYQNKYLFEVNGRSDGSSKFPKSYRFKLFPSASIGWQLGKESFMDWSEKVVDEFKLRASWGKIGNQNIGYYEYRPTMDAFAADWIVNGIQPTTLRTPKMVREDFTWEDVTTIDLGADLSLLNNRLQTTVDWYQRNTEGMLAPGAEFPSVVGAAAPLQNTANLQSRGWEVTLNWRDKVGSWGYNIGFNLSDYRTYITKYKNDAGLFFDRNSAQGKRYHVGMEIGEIWGYKFDRFYTIDDFENTTTWALKPGVTTIKGASPRPGDAMWKNLSDKTGTGEINNGADNLDDPGDRSVIGNETPRFQFGFNTGVNFKGFDLSVFCQGVGKRELWMSNELMFPLVGSDGTGKFGAMYKHQMDYIHVEDYVNGKYTITNPNAKYPRTYGGNSLSGSNKRISDRFLADASYLRVKNITFSYNLPLTAVKTIGLTSAKVFFSGENLFTFTSLPKGVDPERVSWGYPFYATYSFGFNISL